MTVNLKQIQRLNSLAFLLCCFLLTSSKVSGQTQTQLGPKPIGSPSLVDKYRRSPQPTAGSATQVATTRRNTSRFQETSAFQPASFSNASAATNPIQQTVAMQNVPSGNATLPSPGGFSTPPSSSDLSQVIQPQLSTSGFATMNNCNCVSGPSSYSAASGIGCGQNYGYAAPVGYNAPAQQIAAPAQMPAMTPMNSALTGRPLSQAATGAPANALFTLGQSNYSVQVGQGLWGQPVAYVPGQRVRNWIRYMSP